MKFKVVLKEDELEAGTTRQFLDCSSFAAEINIVREHGRTEGFKFRKAVNYLPESLIS